MTRISFGLLLLSLSLALLTGCPPPTQFPTGNEEDNNTDDNSDNGDNNAQTNNSNNTSTNNTSTNSGSNSDAGNNSTPDDTGPSNNANNPNNSGPGEPTYEYAPLGDRYSAEVMPILRVKCAGPACHSVSTGRPFNFDEANPLPADRLTYNLAETGEWVDLRAPANSLFLLYPTMDGHPAHPPANFPKGGPDYATILSWITDSVKVTLPDPPDVPEDADNNANNANNNEPDVGPDVPSGPSDPSAFCASLPDPSSVAGALPYDPFNDHVNPALVRTCTTAIGCHGVGDYTLGGGLWLLRDTEDECHVRWNYLTLRWFINPNPADSISSPLLRKPLGEQDGQHGGQRVFTSGTNDCNYLIMKFWIENNFNAYLNSGCPQ